MDSKFDLTAVQLVNLFNRWMDEYTNHPESFQAEFRTVTNFMMERDSGVEPSYGEACLRYLLFLQGTGWADRPVVGA